MMYIIINHKILFWQAIGKMFTQKGQHMVLRRNPGKKNAIFQLTKTQEAQEMVRLIPHTAGKAERTADIWLAQALQHLAAILHRQRQDDGFIDSVRLIHGILPGPGIFLCQSRLA